MAEEIFPDTKSANLGSLGIESFIEQHPLTAERPLYSRVQGEPLILVAILAKQKEHALPLYLRCIEALDYPKSSITLYIRTNNNTDNTEGLLRDWVERVGHRYHTVEFDSSDVAEQVERYREHEWNATRFSVLARIRALSMRRACELGCAYYFVADVDNFLRRTTLRELVALNLPIVSPLLRSILPEQLYSNYHAEIDANGYYEECDQYQWILSRLVRGIIEVPVVHCTYLVRADVIPQLSYQDETDRHEYVVFSDSARKAGIPQYMDNRQIYGYVTFGEGDPAHINDGIERARVLLNEDYAQFRDNSRWVTGSRPAASEDDVIIGRFPRIATPHKNVLPSHVTLINLDRSVGRLTSFKQNNPHLAIQRFSAIDGAVVDRQKLVTEGIIAEDLAYLPGSLGCALSHISLWKKAVSENKVVTILEDDVVCSFAFEEETNRILSQLPDDWDLIKWGANFYPNFLWMDFGFSKAKLEFYDRRYLTDRIGFQRKRFGPSAIRIAHSFGLQAYSVSPKGARALIDHCLPLRKRFIPFPGTDVVIEDIGIDSAMCSAYASMQAFLCIPPLAIPDQDQVSDRDGIDNQYSLDNMAGNSL